MKILGNEIKPGMIIEHKNDLWSVLKAQHVKPGKGGAFNQVELKSVKKGTKLNERFRSSDAVERAVLDEKKFSFLYEDEPLSVDLPSSVELKIETTDAAIKGQTASSSYKPATLENGIKIMVPPFVNADDKIVLDTRTLEYVKKIK